MLGTLPCVLLLEIFKTPMELGQVVYPCSLSTQAAQTDTLISGMVWNRHTIGHFSSHQLWILSIWKAHFEHSMNAGGAAQQSLCLECTRPGEWPLSLQRHKPKVHRDERWGLGGKGELGAAWFPKSVLLTPKWQWAHTGQGSRILLGAALLQSGPPARVSRHWDCRCGSQCPGWGSGTAADRLRSWDSPAHNL